MRKRFQLILSILLAAALLCGVAGCFAEEPREWTEGNLVTFGRYPQTASGTDETPIEWIVLKVDEENRRALVISKYGLDAVPFNTEDKNVPWETCSLRTWLNEDFLGKAFTPEEQAAILLTDVDNSPEQGYYRFKAAVGGDTRDTVFLLSYLEANMYLNTLGSDNMDSRVAPTAYAWERGAQRNKGYETSEGSPTARWWLRSPGYRKGDGALVLNDGSLGSAKVINTTVCVRPAMWVSLDAVSSNP